MRRNKILPKVGFVLIVAISLSFFIQKTISAAINTATWKLYQNREYGFQIHIPEDWELTGRPILTMFLFGERGTGHREAIAVSVSSVSEETGDIEKIKEDPALTTSQKIVDGYEMFCYENATPEEDSTALVKDGYKTMGCFLERDHVLFYRFCCEL